MDFGFFFFFLFNFEKYWSMHKLTAPKIEGVDTAGTVNKDVKDIRGCFFCKKKKSWRLVMAYSNKKRYGHVEII